MKKNRVLALVLALVTVMSMGTMAFATETVPDGLTPTSEGASSPIEITVEALMQKSRVPFIVPFHVDFQGNVYVAGSDSGLTGTSGLFIHNMSAAPIEVIAAKVDLSSGTAWELQDYNLDEITHYRNLNTNSKLFGFMMNGTPANASVDVDGVTPINVGTEGVMDVTGGTWAIIGSAGYDAAADTVNKTNILELNYDGKFAPQSISLGDVVGEIGLEIGQLYITVDFDTNGIAGHNN